MPPACVHALPNLCSARPRFPHEFKIILIVRRKEISSQSGSAGQSRALRASLLARMW
jgi:hypothetical protein